MTLEERHAERDAHGKQNGLTIVYAPWHSNPSYLSFKTGSLLSRNDEYPSGLVIVDQTGKPSPWSKDSH